MNSVYSFILETLYPDSRWHLFLRICCIGGSTFVLLITTGIVKKKWATRWRAFEVLAGMGIVFWLLQTWIIPNLQRIPDHKAGILIPNLGGHKLREFLGDREINDALRDELEARSREFQDKMMMSGIDTILSFETVSWRAEDKYAALDLMERYNAIGVIWGNVIKLDESARLNCWLDLGIFEFCIYLPNRAPICIDFTGTVSPHFTLGLSDSTYNMDSFARQIINASLPLIIAKMRYTHKEAALELIKRLPTADTAYTESAIAGFVLQSLASGLKELQRPNEAMDYYNLSWNHFMSYYRKQEAGDGDVQLPEKNVRIFAAFSRLSEARICKELNDDKRAFNCYIDAYLAADIDFRKIIREEFQRFLRSAFPNIDVGILDSPEIRVRAGSPFSDL